MPLKNNPSRWLSRHYFINGNCHLEETIDFWKWLQFVHPKEYATTKRFKIWCNFSPQSELGNVNSFTQSKNLKLNFTPRKARKSRQFWYLSRTKLTKRIAFENKCWQLNQIRLVYTQKSYISCSNLPKIGLIWPNFMPSQTFYPNLQIFLHKAKTSK